MHHAELDLTVTHPDCLGERRRIELQRGVSPAAVPGTLYVQWSEGTTVCEVDVELRQAGLVRGVLVGVEDPFDFAVVVAELRAGRPVQPWLAHAMLDAQGRFELRLAPNASYLVVAAARATRPTAVRVDLLAPGVREVVIQPERGVELSGRVRIAPGLSEREVGVELQFARREGDEPPEQWPGPGATLDRLVWLDGAFEWRLRSQRTRDGGYFTFTGLAPREYELRALVVGVPDEELRAWPVARLRAPGSGIEIGPVLASLEIDLGPLPDGPIAFELVEEQEHSISLVSTPSLGPYRTDSHGRAQVHLPPGRAYRVLVAGETVGRIESPAAGEFARFALAR